jgi:hypothetical protein
MVLVSLRESLVVEASQHTKYESTRKSHRNRPRELEGVGEFMVETHAMLNQAITRRFSGKFSL